MKKTVRVLGIAMACSGLLAGCGVEDGANEDDFHNEAQSDESAVTPADIESLLSDLPIADEGPSAEFAANADVLLAAPDASKVSDWLRCQGYAGACLGAGAVSASLCGASLGLACLGAAGTAVTYCAGAYKNCQEAVEKSKGATGDGRELLVDLRTHVGTTSDAVTRLYNKPTSREYKRLVAASKTLKGHVGSIKDAYGPGIDRHIDLHIAKGAAAARAAVDRPQNPPR